MAEAIGLKKWFGDLPVVEAKRELRIQPSEDDIKNAIDGDPKNCVFSRACQRMWGSKLVIFFGTIAYVDLLDKNGNRRVERFIISEEGKKFIRAFDAKEKIKPKGFLLLPPTTSTTRASLTRSSAYQYRKDKKRKALLIGTKKGAQRPKRKPSAIRLSVFRNGSGMVHFLERPQ